MTASPSPAGEVAKARLFVALDLPDAVVAALAAWQSPLVRALDTVRPVTADALHVTLTFLGWQSPEAIVPLAEAVGVCAAGCGGVAGLALGERLWLPRRRPRALAVALEDRHGALAALQGRLVERLAADGRYEPEARSYLPHVTVARARGRNGIRVPRDVALPALDPLVFDGTAVTLYRSRLQSSGARYEPLFVHRLA
ncbi:MAG TPA: RNA 2',3'-cyclic phosphodiesterase [Conexibacter sp.]|nr:RNA 2',3'-cyclic phosphodiesterase [Conexibacter sp.]